MIWPFHRHAYLRETHPETGVKLYVCACGKSQPQIARSEKVEVTKPAHERMRARRQPAKVTRIAQ